MLKAYVGTANWHGLESFLPEDDDSRASVTLQVRLAHNRRRACFWAAVSDDVAKQIHLHLRAGERLQALLTLETLATEITPVHAGH